MNSVWKYDIIYVLDFYAKGYLLMIITKTTSENSLLLKLAGRLDTVTAPELGTEIDAIPETIKELCLDFADLDYVSSAGLRVILTAQTKMNKQGNMIICHACEEVQEIFDITGFADILTIEP